MRTGNAGANHFSKKDFTPAGKLGDILLSPAAL